MLFRILFGLIAAAVFGWGGSLTGNRLATAISAFLGLYLGSGIQMIDDNSRVVISRYGQQPDDELFTDKEKSNVLERRGFFLFFQGGGGTYNPGGFFLELWGIDQAYIVPASDAKVTIESIFKPNGDKGSILLELSDMTSIRVDIDVDILILDPHKFIYKMSDNSDRFERIRKVIADGVRAAIGGLTFDKIETKGKSIINLDGKLFDEGYLDGLKEYLDDKFGVTIDTLSIIEAELTKAHQDKREAVKLSEYDVQIAHQKGKADGAKFDRQVEALRKTLIKHYGLPQSCKRDDGSGLAKPEYLVGDGHGGQKVNWNAITLADYGVTHDELRQIYVVLPQVTAAVGQGDTIVTSGNISDQLLALAKTAGMGS